MALPQALRMLNKPTRLGQGDADVVGALALQIVSSPRIRLATIHASRIPDHAVARSNALQQMFGYQDTPAMTLMSTPSGGLESICCR
jgi:hypothetical protein